MSLNPKAMDAFARLSGAVAECLRSKPLVIATLIADLQDAYQALTPKERARHLDALTEFMRGFLEAPTALTRASILAFTNAAPSTPEPRKSKSRK